MTAGILILAAVALVGAFVVLDRKDARSKAERDADRQERQGLLQRIQAPQVAVVDHSQQLLPDDPVSNPYSDMELAEREKAIQFIEQFENPAVDA